MSAAAFRIGDLELRSRLIIGSGKFRSFEENRKALDAGGCEMTTVAVRRVDLSRRDGGSPVTAQTSTAEGAVRSVRTSRRRSATSPDDTSSRCIIFASASSITPSASRMTASFSRRSALPDMRVGDVWSSSMASPVSC